MHVMEGGKVVIRGGQDENGVRRREGKVWGRVLFVSHTGALTCVSLFNLQALQNCRERFQGTTWDGTSPSLPCKR